MRIGSMFAPAALVILCALPSCAAAQDNLEALSRQGREAMLSGRYPEAVRIYQQMVKALPGEPGARFNLALALDAAARPREALHHLELIKTAEADNSRFWFLLGIEYQKLQQPAKAVDPLARAVRLEPANFDYRAELADAYLASGAAGRAQELFRTLTGERPGDAKLHAGLVRSQLAISKEAFSALRRAAPLSSFCLALAALSEIDKGDKDRAAALYRQALAAQPPAPWLREELDALRQPSPPSPTAENATGAGHPLARLFHAGDFDGVLARTAAVQTPEALYWRARAASELARASLARIASLPPSAQGHELAGLALRDAARWEDSLAEYREAARLAPDDRRLAGEFAKACWLSRRYDEATRLLAPLAASGLDRSEWEFELGDSLVNLGQPEQALPHLRRALELSPGASAAQALLGQVLVQTGDYRSAVPVLEQAARNDRDGSIHFQLATAYRNLGRSDLARQALARQKEIEAAARRAAGPTPPPR